MENESVGRHMENDNGVKNGSCLCFRRKSRLEAVGLMTFDLRNKYYNLKTLQELQSLFLLITLTAIVTSQFMS